MNNIRISNNFTLREFQCKDGSHQVAIDSKLLEKLQRLRDLAGKAINITSGYRNASHNKAVGGSPTSRHLTGQAADIHIAGMTPTQVAKLASQVGFTGIGVYNTFTHVDIRLVPAKWNG